MRTIVPCGGFPCLKTPPINDHQAWKNFILTDEERDGGVENANHQPHPPNLSLILNFDQVGHHKLLGYLVRWTIEDGYNEIIGLWIFSIMACIEKPIHSQVYATLREISRTLSSLRNEDDFDEKSMKSANIIICIIGRYFGQKDMIDE